MLKHIRIGERAKTPIIISIITIIGTISNNNCYESCQRFVRFEAESPKTLDMEDYELLMNSNYLIARKFGTSTESQRQLIRKIKEKCME